MTMANFALENPPLPDWVPVNVTSTPIITNKADPDVLDRHNEAVAEEQNQVMEAMAEPEYDCDNCGQTDGVLFLVHTYFHNDEAIYCASCLPNMLVDQSPEAQTEWVVSVVQEPA